MRATLLIILFVFVPFTCLAMESIGDSIDCTDVSVDFLDNPNLTREERLSLMDRAFYESLNKFELCQAAREMASASASSASGGGAGGDAGADGQAGGGSGGVQGTEGDETAGGANTQTGELSDMSAGIESVASSSMSGTEAEPADPTDLDIPPAEGGSQGSKAGGQKESGGMNSQSGGGVNTDSGGAEMTAARNGATPQDIPPSANDDALAAQIRYAAENETDPEKKAQLWNEYRKYKGLPQK